MLIDFEHPYGRRVFKGILQHANTRNWRLVVEPWKLKPDPLTTWKNRGIDGLIAQVLSPADIDLRRLRVPVVNVSGSQAHQLPTVCTDNVAIGRLAATHLASLPLSHFGYVGTPQRVFSEERQRGFVETLRQAGHDCRVIVTASITEMMRWLESSPKPLGLMCANDVEAFHLLRACALAGFDVRREVALIGVDNEVDVCEFIQPTLTSVDQHPETIGLEAAAMLERLMAGQAVDTPLRLPPREVVVRESTRIDALDAHIAHALSLIRQHATEFSGVDDLLEYIPLGRRTLERRFRSATGRSILDEIRRVRLTEARRLLSTTELSVEQIAARCGYSSASRLGKAMRQESGQSPTEYRRVAQCRRSASRSLAGVRRRTWKTAAGPSGPSTATGPTPAAPA